MLYALCSMLYDLQAPAARDLLCFFLGVEPETMPLPAFQSGKVVLG